MFTFSMLVDLEFLPSFPVSSYDKSISSIHVSQGGVRGGFDPPPPPPPGAIAPPPPPAWARSEQPENFVHLGTYYN